MSFGFGASAPAGGATTGFGGGGFGAAKPANTAAPTGFGGANTGFGANKSGGFGAPTTGATNTGFGSTNTGFGSTSGGFGAAPSTGFGATNTGFGSTSGGFGAAPSTGFGATNTGFGSTSGGFGAAPNTGFGQSMYPGAPPMQQQQQQPQYTFLQNFARQSALANYMRELDAAYDALHPKCRFRTFVYNMCGTGQAMDAIQRDRYVAFMNGGGCDDGDYMVAMHNNPDPEHLYPAPVHFNQEMQQRVGRQKEVIAELTARLEEIMQDTDAVSKLDRGNKQRMKELRLEEAMLKRRWYSLLQKTEVLRLLGVPIDIENLLSHRAEKVRQHIVAPGSFMSVLERLQPYLDDESSLCAAAAHTPGAIASTSTPSAFKRGGSEGNEVGVLANRLSVEPETMQSWLRMVGNMQDGIDTLEQLLKNDVSDMKRIRERVRVNAFN